MSKRMGAASSRVRLYGEDVEVLSDPFPKAGGIAVRVKTTKDAKVRALGVLGLPEAVLQEDKSQSRNAASLLTELSYRIHPDSWQTCALWTSGRTLSEAMLFLVRR